MSKNDNNYSFRAMKLLRYAVVILTSLIILALFAIVYKLIMGDSSEKETIVNDYKDSNFSRVIESSGSLGLFFTDNKIYILNNSSSGKSIIEISVYDSKSGVLSGRFEINCGSMKNFELMPDSALGPALGHSSGVFFTCR